MNETFIDTYVLKDQKYLGILGKFEDFQIRITKGALIYYLRHSGEKVIKKWKFSLTLCMSLLTVTSFLQDIHLTGHVLNAL